MAKLSFSAYAKHRGVSPAAVTKAVQAGRITPERDPRTGRQVLDSATADLQWAANTDSAKQEGSKAHRRSPADALPATTESQSEEPTTTEAPQAPPPSGQTPATMGPAASVALSRAWKEHWNAEMARLKFEERSGKLVEADHVRRQAFSAARVLRESMLNIPDRLAAQLASETDPRKVHDLLSAEIRKALEAVAAGDG